MPSHKKTSSFVIALSSRGLHAISAGKHKLSCLSIETISLGYDGNFPPIIPCPLVSACMSIQENVCRIHLHERVVLLHGQITLASSRCDYKCFVSLYFQTFQADVFVSNKVDICNKVEILFLGVLGGGGGGLSSVIRISQLLLIN